MAAAVLAAPDDAAPIDVVVATLSQGAVQLAQYGQFARARRDLMASSAHLREREMIKMASLSAAVAEALRDRGTDPAQADLTAPAGVTVFTAAYDRWIDTDSASDLPALVQQSLNDLRTAIQPT